MTLAVFVATVLATAILVAAVLVLLVLFVILIVFHDFLLLIIKIFSSNAFSKVTRVILGFLQKADADRRSLARLCKEGILSMLR